MEIYNEIVRDLLAKKGPNRVELKENSTGDLVAQNLLVKKAKSMEQIEQMLNEATDIRSTGRTDINEFSSRSHLILTIHVTCTNHELK